MEQNSLIVIDANSLVNRAFYAMPGITTSRGKPTGAIYGFTTMLIKLIEQYRPSYIAAAFDVHAPTFRHKLSDKYKATRKPMPPDLAAQMQPLKDLLAAMRIKTYELAGYEADDIIGTIAKRSGVFTYIVTGDRDSLQLVGDRTHALLTKKGISELIDVSPDNVADVFGVRADRVVDFKALAGDSSDNIPGVPGIGDKTAVDLIKMYGSLDGIYDRISEISGAKKTKLEAGKDDAYLSYKLATINTDVPVDFSLSDCKLRFPFGMPVKAMFDELDFNSLSSREKLFAAEPEQPATDVAGAECITLDGSERISEIAARAAGGEAAVLITDDGVHLAFSPDVDYFAPITNDLLSAFTLSSCISELAKTFESKNIITFGLKSLLHKAYPAPIPRADDVSLMAYLLEYRVSPMTAAELFSLRDECRKELASRSMTELYGAVELELSRVLFDMERTGFCIDKQKLDEISEKFTEREAESMKRIRELCGDREINLNSPKQLAKLLFEDMGIPYPERNAKTYSTKAEVLQKLAGEYEIADEILKYRFNSKLRSTFLDGVRKALDGAGLVHTSFNQTVTTTGRLSSTDPNLQNIPTRNEDGKILRSMFIGRTPENVLVDADYSQIELKLLAHFSGDPKMIEAFRTGSDIHTSTAAEVFGVPVSEVTPELRRNAKAVNFGIIYGMSNYGLSQNIHISQKQATEYIERYFERFPSVKAYLDGLIESAKKTGYAVTMFGRRRSIPELNSAKYLERKFGERVAMNTPLQGSAADIIKITMIRVHKRLAGMKSRLIMQVHDELIVDAVPEEADKVADILREEMTGAVSLSVPLDVDISIGKNWMECK